MTFLEKAKESNSKFDVSICNKSKICPEHLGLEGWSPCEIYKGNCEVCWNREMLDTEENEDNDKEWLDGYEKGKIDGLNDAWELAEKIWCKMGMDTREDAFGFEYATDIMKHLTPQEALAKLKAYEDNKIKVGDVVVDLDGKERVVLFVDFTGKAQIYGSHGVTNINKEHLKKTGRHIDISSILEQIGE